MATLTIDDRHVPELRGLVHVEVRGSLACLRLAQTGAGNSRAVSK